ncbi:MAG: hypothetical protein O7A08_14100 [SAR324 cluster bacterium]|nr:hypothetical protein [SAR324 cluster bacterium]
MKKISVSVALLAVTMAWSMTAFAGQCPSLMKQIDEKLSMASLSEMDAKKVRSLRKDGAYHHRKGEHGKSVRILNKALAKLEM